MSDAALLHWFPYAFPFLFTGMWLLIMTSFGFMSGWFDLQQRYPDEGRDEPLLTLGFQSGSMGRGVSFGNCLVLRSYPSGLGIAVWRIFGPFQKPLLVPWRDIQATQKKSLFYFGFVRLDFGRRSIGNLTIRSKVWDRLIRAANRTAG